MYSSLVKFEIRNLLNANKTAISKIPSCNFLWADDGDPPKIKTKPDEEEMTHTGQKWDLDDVRSTRFLVYPKKVNKNFSINLIKNVPIKYVNQRVVACDGGPTKALGHPRIYINLDKPGPHVCIYCGLRYEYRPKDEDE